MQSSPPRNPMFSDSVMTQAYFQVMKKNIRRSRAPSAAMLCPLRYSSYLSPTGKAFHLFSLCISGNRRSFRDKHGYISCRRRRQSRCDALPRQTYPRGRDVFPCCHNLSSSRSGHILSYRKASDRFSVFPCQSKSSPNGITPKKFLTPDIITVDRQKR